jgi:hypothetical protein
MHANAQGSYGDARTLCDDAQESAEKALSLYRAMGDAHGEAECNEELNRIMKVKSRASRDRHADKKREGSARAVRNRTRAARRM